MTPLCRFTTCLSCSRNFVRQSLPQYVVEKHQVIGAVHKSFRCSKGRVIVSAQSYSEADAPWYAWLYEQVTERAFSRRLAVLLGLEGSPTTDLTASQQARLSWWRIGPMQLSTWEEATVMDELAALVVAWLAVENK